MRFLFVSLLLVAIFYFLSGRALFRAEIIFFNVGQGDSFALRTPGGKVIVVDGGPDWSCLYYLGKWLGFGRRQIDILIFTHDHDDHFAALPEILMRYRVGHIFLPARLSDSSKSYLETSRSSDSIVPENINENKCFNLETNCHLCLFPPSAEFLSAKDENDLSMVLHFACDGLSLVAAGDAGEKRERQLLSLDFNWHAQIFKASHHGSASANSEEFLRAVSPLAMIFSVGASNKYKHPAVEIIERARRLGIKMWRTDQMGSILLYANNRQLFFKSGGF